MPEVDERQVAETTRPQRLHALPELDVFASPSHERLIEATDGQVRASTDGQTTPVYVLDNFGDRFVAAKDVSAEYVLRRLASEIEGKPLQINGLQSRANASDNLGSVSGRGKHVVVVKDENWR